MDAKEHSLWTMLRKNCYTAQYLDASVFVTEKSPKNRHSHKPYSAPDSSFSIDCCYSNPCQETLHSWNTFGSYCVRVRFDTSCFFFFKCKDLLGLYQWCSTCLFSQFSWWPYTSHDLTNGGITTTIFTADPEVKLWKKRVRRVRVIKFILGTNRGTIVQESDVYYGNMGTIGTHYELLYS